MTVARHSGAKESVEDDQSKSEAAIAADTQIDDTSSDCCIGCFRAMSLPPESLPEGFNDDTSSPEPQLLCASCILRLAGKSSKSPAVKQVSGGGVLSPLPKLSLLVKAEAKCQDQLQLLRSQQEVLNQQRESLEATKRTKEEALAAERELAKQRRKHFLMIQERRKREEELKFQQFQTDEHTSRSEQETTADKPKKKKPKPPKVVNTPSDTTLPHVAEAASKHVETPQSHSTNSNDVASTAEKHSASLYERRRQMMVCYSQDLSPLIDGRKPRRLPFPKPVAAVAPSIMLKRRQTPDNNAQLVTNHRNNNQRKLGKSPASKITKLRPLEEQKQYIKTKPQLASNQFEDFRTQRSDEVFNKRIPASPLSLQLPQRLLDNSAPLTAEIKPVSWAYELTKEVLPQDDTTDESSVSAPLRRVAEEDEGPQFTMFPLQHQLPIPTFPPSKPEPPVDTTTKSLRWEYSAERLSSLLEKYNVSVSAVTTTSTKAPKL